MCSNLQDAPDIVTQPVHGQSSGKAVCSNPRDTQKSITEEGRIRCLRKVREIRLLEILECLALLDRSS